jgi:hypothetical protein
MSDAALREGPVEPIDGAKLLDQIMQPFSFHLSLDDGGPETFTLYSAFTYAIDLATYAPRLHLRSPTPGCGKSTALDVLANLVRDPNPVSEITRAGLIRATDAGYCQLIDEADHSVAGQRALYAVLNSGWFRPYAWVEQMGKRFRTFSSMVFGGIGRLSSTLEDRCIVLRMEKAAGLPKFRTTHAAPLHELGRKTARFIVENTDLLQVYEPPMPDGLTARQENNWSMLIAIADIAGGEWPVRARQACLRLTSDTAEPSPLEGLLRDIQMVWPDNAPKIKSSDLVARLQNLEGHPWATLNPTQLATHLRGFSDGHGGIIEPNEHRFGTGVAAPNMRGYEFWQFASAFERYVNGVAGVAHVATTTTLEQVAAAIEAARPKAAALKAQREAEERERAAARERARAKPATPATPATPEEPASSAAEDAGCTRYRCYTTAKGRAPEAQARGQCRGLPARPGE